jgi:hypothetical protein
MTGQILSSHNSEGNMQRKWKMMRSISEDLEKATRSETHVIVSRASDHERSFLGVAIPTSHSHQRLAGKIIGSVPSCSLASSKVPD